MSFFRRRKREEELQEELQFHLEEEAEQRAAQGLPVDEAHWAARRDLGSVALVKETTRDTWGWTAAGHFMQDLRYTLRGLRQSPGFALTAIAILAVGIGINSMVFSVTDAALFKGFPMVERPEQLLFLSSYDGCCVSYPTYLDWKQQALSFQNMAIVHGVNVKLEGLSTIPEWYDATEISAETFRLVGQKPLLGRDFSEADEIAGAPQVVILNYGFWERRFALDRGIIGRTIRLNGAPATIVGVMPKGFTFPQKLEMWVPLVRTVLVMKRENRDTWYAFGRLKDGVGASSARSEMDTIGKRLADAHPLTEKEFRPVVQTFTEFYLGRNAPTLYASMWGAVGFVLLIVCANLANLMLARSVGRAREISVRLALGAGRWRIIRQLLVESVLLSSIGGVLGWWLAKIGVSAYERAMIDHYSWLVVDYTMDSRVLAYLVAISLATGILFGLAPALRLSKLDVNASLKDGGRGATGARVKRLSGVLVVVEMALAVVLLAGAGLMIRSFVNVYTEDLGADIDNTLQVGLDLPEKKYSSEELRQSFYTRLQAQVASLPGVASATITSHLPTWEPARFHYEIAGTPPTDVDSRPRAARLLVSPSYFPTFRADVISGRNFNAADDASAVDVVIVNQRFAANRWPGESPLGKRLRIYEMEIPGPWLTVVGVAPNILQSNAAKPEFAEVLYQPHSQLPIASMSVVVRTLVPPETLASALRKELAAVDPALPVWNIRPVEQILRSRYWGSQFYGSSFLLFAVVALLVASVGLYSVIAHSVSQRTQELGVRMALGGTTADIRRLVFRQGMTPVAIGLAMGLAASLALNRLLAAFLVQVSPSDPLTLFAVAAVLIAAATLGCLIPARRAMRVDPVVALRHD